MKKNHKKCITKKYCKKIINNNFAYKYCRKVNPKHIKVPWINNFIKLTGYISLNDGICRRKNVYKSWTRLKVPLSLYTCIKVLLCNKNKSNIKDKLLFLFSYDALSPIIKNDLLGSFCNVILWQFWRKYIFTCY